MDHMSLLQLLMISLLEAVLITILGFQLAGLKISLQHLLIIGIVQTVLTYLVRLLPIPFGVHSFVYAVIYILIIKLITGINFRTVIITALLGLTLYASLEAVLAPTMVSLSGYSFREVINSQYLRIVFYLPEAAIIIMIIIACKRHNFCLIKPSPEVYPLTKKGGRFNPLEKHSFYLYFLILLPIQLLVVLNLVFFNLQTAGFPNRYLGLFMALLSLAELTLTILLMGIVKKITTLKEKEFEAEKAEEIIAQLDKIIKLIRKQRHDFNHHLQTVYGLLEVEAYETARDYVRQMFLNISTPAELIKTDKPGISALLYAKAGLAEARGINFNVQIECSLRDLPLTTMEANSLLGNLLDNAIEAAADYLGAYRFVRLDISREQEGFVFSIANIGEPIPGEVQDRLFDSYYTTKGKKHGLGLVIVKEIVKKYSGTIDIAAYGKEIVITVYIPVKGLV